MIKASTSVLTASGYGIDSQSNVIMMHDNHGESEALVTKPYVGCFYARTDRLR